jgi:hypothetical protein
METNLNYKWEITNLTPVKDDLFYIFSTDEEKLAIIYLPDGAEYWWDIRGHSYESSPSKNHVSGEESAISWKTGVGRLSTRHKAKIRKLLIKIGLAASHKEAIAWVSKSGLTYQGILALLREQNLINEET